jgi:hypothetical protein
MRGARQPALRLKLTVPQDAFRALSRHRRWKLARVARTTLVKADQWARGGSLPAETAAALESALQALQARAPKNG